MSFDKRIIYHGLFAESWAAATNVSNLRKVFKGQDIEAIDILKTCENLQSAIEHSAYLQKNNLHSHGNNLLQQATPLAPKQIPFRVASRLCFGTVRIFQRQVNTLFEKTRDLLALSKVTMKKPVTAAIKRNSSDRNVAKGDGKRRRILAPIENILTDYTKGLIDAEQQVEWPTAEELLSGSKFKENITGRKKTQRSPKSCLTRVQISEITIREINTEYTLPEFEDIDADNGFGNATSDELAEWMDIFAGKLGLPPASNLPQPVSNHIQEEMVIGDRGKSVEQSLTFVREYRSIDTVRNEQSPVTSDILDSFQLGAFSNRDDSPAPSCDALSLDQQGSKRATLSPVPQAVSPINQLEVNTSMVEEKRRSRRKRLIIDKHTTLSESVLRRQWENHAKLQRPAIMPHKIKQTECSANDLLNRFNRRNITNCDLKQKRKISADQIRTDYHTALSEILGRYVDDDLAAEVWNGWKSTAPTAKKRKRAAAKSATNMMELDTSLDSSAINQRGRECSSQVDSRELQSYSILVKLISLWNHAGRNAAIEAECFFANVHKRLTAATTLSTLLVLAAKQTITLISSGSSIQLQSIKIEPAAEQYVRNYFEMRMQGKVQGVCTKQYHESSLIYKINKK